MQFAIEFSQDVITFIKLLIEITVQLLGLYIGGRKLWKEIRKDIEKAKKASAKKTRTVKTARRKTA